MSIPIIGKLIDTVVGLFAMDQESKNIIKQQRAQALIDKDRRKHELQAAIEQAAIDRTKRKDDTEANYDLIAQENARNSSIDEIMIFWVLCIVSLMFIPNMQPYVISGFGALDKHVPLWFQLVFVGGFISKLGLRFLFTGRTLFK